MRPLLTAAALLLCGLVTIDAQFSMSAFESKPSDLLVQVDAIKNSAPSVSPDELARRANELLAATGFTYSMILDASSCDQLKALVNTQLEAKKNPQIVMKLPSIGGDTAAIVVPQPKFPSCGPCTIDLPIVELTGDTFVTILLGRNVKFAKPMWMSSYKVSLEGTPSRSWHVPFAGQPIGLTEDREVVYMPLPEPDLKELSLAVFSSGVFQIATRAEADSTGKLTSLTPADSGEQRLAVQQGKERSVLLFTPACKR